MDSDLRVSRDGFVVTLELDRPPGNHLDADLLATLADRLDALTTDPGCRAVVLVASGAHFCLGADLTGRSGARPDGAAELDHQAVRVAAARLPVVAAVQGAAVGVGLGLACLADRRIGTPHSRFQLPAARPGPDPDLGLTATLPAIVGPAMARRLRTTATAVDGARALHIGLIDRLVPPDALRSAARAFAAELAGAPTATKGAAVRTALVPGPGQPPPPPRFPATPVGS